MESVRTQSVQPKMEFKTGLKKIFYRTTDSAIMARSVICKLDDEPKFPLIQVGRFKNGWDASRYMIALNEDEVKWMIDFIPSMVKRAYKQKDETDTLIESIDFDGNRSLSVTVVRFKKAKQLEFKQTVIRNDTEVERSVSFPLKTVSQMVQVFRYFQMIHNMVFKAEYRMSMTTSIFEAFLAFALEIGMKKASTDGSLNEIIDADLLARMKGKSLPSTYWIAAKYVSVNFIEFKSFLDQLFEELTIQHFDETRLNPSKLLSLFTDNTALFAKPQDIVNYDFVKFLMDSFNTY